MDTWTISTSWLLWVMLPWRLVYKCLSPAFHALGCILKRGIAGSYGNSMFVFGGMIPLSVFWWPCHRLPEPCHPMSPCGDRECLHSVSSLCTVQTKFSPTKLDKPGVPSHHPPGLCCPQSWSMWLGHIRDLVLHGLSWAPSISFDSWGNGKHLFLFVG